jgi:CRP-like cAMP-binding protein
MLVGGGDLGGIGALMEGVMENPKDDQPQSGGTGNGSNGVNRDGVTAERPEGSRKGLGLPFPWLPEWATGLISGRHEPPDQIIAQGAPAVDVCLLATGTIKLTMATSSGDEVVVGVRHAGRAIGLGPALLGVLQPLSAVALEPCEVHRMAVGALRSSLETDPRLAEYVRHELACEAQDQIAHATGISMPSRERLITALLRIAGVEPGHAREREVKVPPLLRQWEIAQLVGLTPQYLSALLGKLEAEGVIYRRKGWLVVRRSP